MPKTLVQHFGTLTKAGVASLVALAVELALLPTLYRVLPPLVAFAAVQVAGTTVTFVLNKYWAFDAARVGRIPVQGAQSLVVFVGSLVLNTALPTLGTRILRGYPVLAFIGSQGVVYLAWNYPLNRWWVFRPPVKSC